MQSDKFFYFSIAFSILANGVYHIFQKSISPAVNPLVSLVATYLTALVLIALAWPFYPAKEGFTESLKGLNWASFALAFGVVGMEIGYLFVYRSGWNLSLASPVANAGMTLLLVPVGLLFFHETISLIKIAGLSLCVGGIILINL